MKKIIQFSLFFFILAQSSSCVGYSAKLVAKPMGHYYKLPNPDSNWKEMDIYSDIDSTEQYKKLVRIVVTGRDGSSEDQLLKKMKKEASKYRADAILHIETREVDRSSFNGVAAAINIISIFSESGVEADLHMGGDYFALEVEGIAINFVEED